MFFDANAPVVEEPPRRRLIRGTAAGARCGECPFARNGEPSRPVFAEGPIDPKWIVVGEGPGKNEAMLGRPFVGQSGMMVNKAIQMAGAQREDVWVTNVTLCLPTENSPDSARVRAQKCCAPRLLEELARFPQKPMLALGGVATQAFLGRRLKVSELAGSYHFISVGSVQMREVADQIDDVDALRDKTTTKIEKGTKNVLAARKVHHAECERRDMEDPQHLKTCKRAKRVLKFEAGVNENRRALGKLDETRAALQLQFDVLARETSDPPRAIIPSIHPAAILRGGAGVGGAHSPDLAFWNLLYDAVKVHGISQGRDLVFCEKDYDVEFQDADRADQLVDRVIADARRLGDVTVDCETYVEDPTRSALQPLHAKLRALGLGTREWSISVYWHILHAHTRDKIAELLADESVSKTFHNQLYDRPTLKANGYPIEGATTDTLLMHHNVFPGMSHRLQHVATQFFAITPWKSEFRDADDTPEALVHYNAKDVLTTARIKAPLQILIRKNEAERGYALDLSMARIAQEMHERGVPVDQEINSTLGKTFASNIAAARRGIEEKAADPEIRMRLWARLAFEQAQRKRKKDSEDFGERVEERAAEIEADFNKGKWSWSISNADHVVAYLKARNIPMLFKTKSGKTSTEKKILESLSHIPEVADIVTYRENDKLLSTFVKPMYQGTPKRAPYADENGRIHPIWSVHAITTRWRAHNPMAQNWPKADKKKGRPNLRSQVVAPKGRKFVGFDFAQLEARVIALMSGDPFLVDLFANDRDIHSEFARIVWPDFDQQEKEIRKSLRDMIKRPEYGWLFGGGLETLWKNVVKDYPKVKLADIGRMVQQMEKAMPGVIRWHNDLVKMAARPPYEIKSAIYNRRRCFPLGNADVTDLYNWPVQTTGALIMNTGLERICQILPQKYKEAFPILHIHDAAVIECWEDDAEMIAADVLSCFSQEFTINGITVKFPVDPEIGDTWADV